MGGLIFYVSILRLGKEQIIMKRYGYHRTSTREQHLDRGIKEITAYCKATDIICSTGFIFVSWDSDRKCGIW